MQCSNEPFSWGATEKQGCGINTRTHVELIGIHGGPWLVHCFRFLAVVAIVVADAIMLLLLFGFAVDIAIAGCCCISFILVAGVCCCCC